MSEIIGVIPAPLLFPQFGNNRPNLKQFILAFDRIAVTSYNIWRDEAHDAEPFEKHPQRNDVMQLYEKGILFDSPLSLNDSIDLINNNILNNIEQLHEKTYMSDMTRLFKGVTQKDFRELTLKIELNDYCLMNRLISIAINNKFKYDTQLLTPYFNPFYVNDENDNNPILFKIYLNRIPVPREDTPIEKIIDFKNDSDTVYKYSKIKHWLFRIATLELSVKEIEEELNESLLDYKRHMELYKIETKYSAAEMIVVTISEVLENLMRLKWGHVAKSCFSLKRTKVRLLKEEMKAPGASVAYIAKIEEHFKNN